MENIRKSIEYTPSAINMLDRQGDALVRFIAYRHNQLDSEDLFILQNFICPEWLLHVVNIHSSDPAKFFYERYDDRSAYNDGDDLSWVTITELADPAYTNEILELCSSIRASGKSRLTKETIFDAPVRSYIRYATPVDFGDNEKHLLVFCKYLEIEGKSPKLAEREPKNNVGGIIKL